MKLSLAGGWASRTELEEFVRKWAGPSPIYELNETQYSQKEVKVHKFDVSKHCLTELHHGLDTRMKSVKVTVEFHASSDV